MAGITYFYCENSSACTDAALKKEHSLKECGEKTLLISAKHISSLQMMEDSDISKYEAVLVDEAHFLKKNQVEFLLHIINGIKINVYLYGRRVDDNNQPYEGAMYALAWASEIERLSVNSVNEVEEDTGNEAEAQLSPMLLEFLDARTYNDRLEIFRRIRDNTDNDMLNIMAVVLDIDVPENKDIERRRDDIYSCLVTLARFEVNR